jgi:hypothetical protein
MPVGDPYAVTLERQVPPGPFFVVRNVEWDGMRASHQGADLGSGEAGAVVRAAAAGLVVRTADHGEHGGYGTHVVLAHRLPEGVLAYSVYAHLRLGSIRVKPGRFVPAGAPLGRVGMTGRASAPHLHFEIRIARDPRERWEFADVEDPLAFIEERLPAHRADTTGVAAYLEWAEFAALLPAGARGDDALTRERWWRMLAAAARGPLLDPAASGLSLHDSLVGAGVLRREVIPGDPRLAPTWTELARDLARVRRTGVRTGPGPLRRARHELVCASQLGASTPARHASALSARAGTPSLTDAVVLLADVAGPVPEPPAPKPAAKRASAGGVAKAATPAGVAGPSPAVRGVQARPVPGQAAGRIARGARSAGSQARADSIAPAIPAGPRPAGTEARASSPDSKRSTAVRSARSAPRPDTAGAGARPPRGPSPRTRPVKAAADSLPAPPPPPAATDSGPGRSPRGYR